MRTLAVLVLAVLVGCGRRADTPPTVPDEPAAKVGRLAPPVAFGQWLQGDPIPGLEPGKVYVLDFWASWCGPCLQAMPHLQQTADEFAGRATVIGVTVLDDRNPLAAVMDRLAALKANRHAVRHATIDRATQAEYAVNAFPTVVVIGPDGRVAYRGNPLLVDGVLDGVLAGTWKGKTSAAAVEAMADDLAVILGKADRNPAAALTELTAFEAAHPAAAGRAGFRVAKVSVLRTAGRADEARAVTEELLPALTDRKDVRSLSQLGMVWADPKRGPDRTHADLAVRAAEALVAVEGPDDPGVQAQLAAAHLFAGDKDKAKAVADRALAATPDGSPLKKWLTDLRQKCE